MWWGNEAAARGYLDFLGFSFADSSSSSSPGRPCLAMKARALSAFLIKKGSLL